MLATRVSIILASVILIVNCDFWNDREAFIANEELKMVGYDKALNHKESLVNVVLMKLKHAEYDAGVADPSTFLPAQHFFKSRERIEQSPVFKFIRKFPKGAALHGHAKALSSPEFLFSLTYMQNLYACQADDAYLLHFFLEPNSKCEWKLVSQLRDNDSNYDEYLKSKLTLVVDDPQTTYKDINDVWKKLETIFDTVSGLLGYYPAFTKYFENILQEHYDDNVMYVEVRDVLSTLYDLHSNEVDKIFIAENRYEAQVRFMQSHPYSRGAKIIYSVFRGTNDTEKMEENVNSVIALKQYYPDFIVGFDVVGQEDLGQPLMYLLPEIQKLQSENINLYFHAGETNWYGVQSDRNLIDAVLLGAKRLGHGYALNKHPDALAYCKANNIAIEISPISSQVLMLVKDIRNHPGAGYIAQGQNVVICNDDPALWGAKGLSYDWYLAFMGMTSRDADLRLLKQLAINSIQYSGANATEKGDALIEWAIQWDVFLDSILAEQN